MVCRYDAVSANVREEFIGIGICFDCFDDSFCSFLFFVGEFGVLVKGLSKLGEVDCCHYSLEFSFCGLLV